MMSERDSKQDKGQKLISDGKELAVDAAGLAKETIKDVYENREEIISSTKNTAKQFYEDRGKIAVGARNVIKKDQISGTIKKVKPWHGIVATGFLIAVYFAFGGGSEPETQTASNLPVETAISGKDANAAVISGDIQTVRTYLNQGHSPNSLWDEYSLPLERAVTWNQIEVARLLLKEGADPNGVLGSSRQTPLTTVAISVNKSSNERIKMAQLLLDNGAEIDNTSSQGGITAFMLAVAREVPDIPLAEFLFDQGANPNAANTKGWTAFGLARDGGTAEAVQFLRSIGAG